MPFFNYKAVDEHGRSTRGQLQANNAIDLEMRLERMGLYLISLSPLQRSSWSLLTPKFSTKDLAMFCFQLEVLVNAGVPLLSALAEVRETIEHIQFRKILDAVIADVEGGKQFSRALGEHPQVFSEVFVSLVATGEHTGEFATVFRNLFDTLRWQNEIAEQTKKLLLYPAFTGVIVLGAVVFLMNSLVPQMAIFLQSMGQELPVQTRFLIEFSRIFSAYWWLMSTVLVMAILGAILLVKKNTTARMYCAHLQIKLPLIGTIMRKVIMTRFSRYCALMYQSGIPILDALKICERIVGNAVVAGALHRASLQVQGGEKLSTSLRDTGLFPSLVIRMMSIGENTGALDKALLNVSYFYDREIQIAMDKLLAMLEPALTIILGLILAFIMLAVLGPVYDSFSQLKL